MDPFTDAERARAGRARRARIANMLLGGVIILLACDLVISLIIPFVGLLQIVLLRNLLFPAQPLPDQTLPYATSITTWGESVYAGDSLSSTGVFDRQSGKRLETIPGIVVGSDDQFLYTNTGSRGLGNRVTYASKLSARGISGALAWTFDAAPYSLAALQSAPGIQPPQPQIVSDAENVYALLINRQSLTAMSKLVALNKATGAVRWSVANPPADQLVVARGALVLLTRGYQAQVAALSVSDGRMLWRQPYTNAQIFTDGSLIYVVTAQGMQALSPTTGARVWSANEQVVTPATTDAPPTLFDNGSVYLLSASGQISALRASDGRKRWQIAAAPATSHSTLLAARNGVLYFWQDTPTLVLTAIDVASGHTLWATSVQVNRPRLTGVTDTTIYLSAYTWCKSVSQSCAQYFAITRQSGKLAWSHAEPQALTTDGIAPISAAVHDQSLYLTTLVRRMPTPPRRFDIFGPAASTSPCSETMTLASLSAAAGAVLWRHTTTTPCATTAP